MSWRNLNNLILTISHCLVPKVFTSNRVFHITFSFGSILTMIGFGHDISYWANVVTFGMIPLPICAYLVVIYCAWILTLIKEKGIRSSTVEKWTCILYIGTTLLTLHAIPGLAAVVCLFQWRHVNVAIICTFVYALAAFNAFPNAVPGRIARHGEQMRALMVDTKRDMTRYLSHEIRTPLIIVATGLDLSIEELKEDPIDSKLVVETLRDARTASRSEVGLFDDMMNKDSIEVGIFLIDAYPEWGVCSLIEVLQQFENVAVSQGVQYVSLLAMFDQDGLDQVFRTELFHAFSAAVASLGSSVDVSISWEEKKDDPVNDNDMTDILYSRVYHLLSCVESGFGFVGASLGAGITGDGASDKIEIEATQFLQLDMPEDVRNHLNEQCVSSIRLSRSGSLVITIKDSHRKVGGNAKLGGRVSARLSGRTSVRRSGRSSGSPTDSSGPDTLPLDHAHSIVTLADLLADISDGKLLRGGGGIRMSLSVSREILRQHKGSLTAAVADDGATSVRLLCGATQLHGCRNHKMRCRHSVAQWSGDGSGVAPPH